MYLNLIGTAAKLHQDDLLQEAQHERLAASFSQQHAWRNRVGTVLITVGRLLTDEPRSDPAQSRPRARVA